MIANIRIFVVLYLCSAFSLQIGYCQDKKSFEKIFDKEDIDKATRGSKKFKNISTFSYYPDTLPQWFFTPPQSNENIIYSIGISDPDMELIKAKELAIHRAKALACICLKSKFQYFRDMYTSEQQEGKYSTYRQRFDTYFKISALSLIDEEFFSVIDTHFTRYNEYVALIKFTPSAVQKSKMIVSAVGTVLYIEAQVKDAFEVQAEYELKSTFKSPEMRDIDAHYLYREKGNKFLTNSTYLGSTIDFPVYVYKYASPFWTENTTPLTSYNGLWSKFTQELFRYLTLTTEESRKRIKNMGQQYNPENANLSREVASLAASLKLNGIEFARDTIKFNIQIKEEYARVK